MPGILFCSVSYKVNFLGLQNRDALKAVKESSDLINLRKRPPASMNALRYRIESDIPQMIEALNAFAYYDAVITSEIENEKNKVIVYIFIHPGPQYELKKYQFYSSNCKEKKELKECPNLTLKKLGITLHDPAYARHILDAEQNLLRELANCGYPLATIHKSDIFVDVLEKSVSVDLCIDTGPECHFGPLTIIGLKDVKTKFLARKIQWKEGDLYNEDLVEETQDMLINTDLFSSVLISHSKKLDDQGRLPMKLQLAETKHKSISLGVSFSTLDMFGGMIAWENRNLFQMGQYLGLNLSVSRIYSAGVLTYRYPDFFRMGQSFVSQTTASREHVTPYLAMTYANVNRVETRFGVDHMLTYGVSAEYIDVTKSIADDDFVILSIPLFYKLSLVENILNPLSGFILTYHGSPSQSVLHKKFHYIKQRLSGAGFIPLDKKKKVVLALKAEAGSIWGASLDSLPFNKRFLGGSDENLRGYKFKTVSPLNQNGNPTGGRGAILGSIELRLRLTEKIGLVPFFDFGNITDETYPTVKGKWYKSVGGGFRYFLFFGPLRIDAGFPLDRREGIDPFYNIYISIGQMF